MNCWLRLVVGSAKSNLGRRMGHMPPICTILCMCFALGLPQILGASRAASASPGGVYEKTRFRKNRKFRSQLFKRESMSSPPFSDVITAASDPNPGLNLTLGLPLSTVHASKYGITTNSYAQTPSHPTICTKRPGTPNFAAFVYTRSRLVCNVAISSP